MSSVRIVNRLPAFVAGRQRAAEAAMTRALILGASEAAVLTPIDTSNLLNSQYREVRSGGGEVVGRVGYTADYAGAVHDPDVKQNFRRSTAEKLFLVKGFERAEPQIRSILANSLRA